MPPAAQATDYAPKTSLIVAETFSTYSPQSSTTVSVMNERSGELQHPS